MLWNDPIGAPNCSRVDHVVAGDLERTDPEAGERGGGERTPLVHRVRVQLRRLVALGEHDRIGERAVGERRVAEVRGRDAGRVGGAAHEAVAVERDDDARDRARGHEARDAGPGRAQRQGGDGRALGDGAGERAGTRQQPGGDRVLDERRGGEPPGERLDRDREVQQGRAASAVGVGQGHARRAGGDELLPELGVEPEGLALADDGGRRVPVGEGAEHLDDRLLLVGEFEIHGAPLLRRSAGRFGRRDGPVGLRCRRACRSGTCPAACR